MADRVTLPWIPGLTRPKFVFYKIRIAIPTRIPPSLIYGLIYLSILYIYAGGVYDLVEEPFARGSGPNGDPILILADQDRQFLIEGIVAGVVMFMGAAGLYLIGEAATDPHKPDRATAYQAMGIILIVLAFLILQSMYNCKITGECQ